MNQFPVRRILGAIAASVFCLSAVAADETELRDLDGFHSIEVGGSVDLTVQQGRSFRVQVTAQDGRLEDLLTEVHGDTLQIGQQQRGFRWFNFFSYDNYRVEVTLPELSSISAGGGSDVRTDGEIIGESLLIRASGGSDVRMDVNVASLAVRTSGGSDTVVVGSTDALEARSSGGSDLMAAELLAREATVRSSGGSDVSISVTDRFVARASGGSDIFYSGDPSIKEIDSSGGADVIHR